VARGHGCQGEAPGRNIVLEKRVTQDMGVTASCTLGWDLGGAVGFKP